MRSTARSSVCSGGRRGKNDPRASAGAIHVIDTRVRFVCRLQWLRARFVRPLHAPAPALRGDLRGMAAMDGSRGRATDLNASRERQHESLKRFIARPRFEPATAAMSWRKREATLPPVTRAVTVGCTGGLPPVNLREVRCSAFLDSRQSDLIAFCGFRWCGNSPRSRRS